MRLLIADDHGIVLEGVEALLRNAGYAIAERCTSGDEVVAAIEARPPDVMVLDVQMPGPDGLEILRRVKHRNLPIRVILLSSSINNVQALEAIRLGVDGLVLKEAAGSELIECLANVCAGRQWLGPRAARLALEAAVAPASGRPTDLLTPRERDVAERVARGQRNKEIARELNVTEGTVKMHLHNIYEKLQVKNRTELALVARDSGLR
jgi:two-component system nitrate/nitrite response regulator NarP